MRAAHASVVVALLSSLLLVGAAASSLPPAVSDDGSAVSASEPAATSASAVAVAPASRETAASRVVDTGVGAAEPAADAIESTATMQVVPDILGRSLTDARAALASAGLLVGPMETAHAPQAADTVTATEVAAGAEVPSGSAISLTVATGSNVVPDVEGLDAELAAAIVARAGFVAEVSFVEAGTLLDGRVVGEAPLRGTVLRLGSTVALIVGGLGEESSAGA